MLIGDTGKRIQSRPRPARQHDALHARDFNGRRNERTARGRARAAGARGRRQGTPPAGLAARSLHAGDASAPGGTPGVRRDAVRVDPGPRRGGARHLRGSPLGRHAGKTRKTAPSGDASSATTGVPWVDVNKRRDIESAAEEIEQLFADLWQVFPFSRGLRRGYRPQVDVYRNDVPPTLTVTIELPGVDPDDVQLVAG